MNELKILFETVDFTNSSKWRFLFNPATDEFYVSQLPTIQKFDNKPNNVLAPTLVSRDTVQVQALINQTHIDDKQRNVLRHLGFFVSRDIRIVSHKTIQHHDLIGVFYWHWYEVIVKKQYEATSHYFESTLQGQCDLKNFLLKQVKNVQRRQNNKVKA